MSATTQCVLASRGPALLAFGCVCIICCLMSYEGQFLLSRSQHSALRGGPGAPHCRLPHGGQCRQDPLGPHRAGHPGVHNPSAHAADLLHRLRCSPVSALAASCMCVESCAADPSGIMAIQASLCANLSPHMHDMPSMPEQCRAAGPASHVLSVCVPCDGDTSW